MNIGTSVAMTVREAQEWDAEVGRAGNYLRLLLQDGYRREVWRVLGYSNWTDCLSALADKHGFTERRLWQLHQANEIQSRLTEHCSVDEMIPEGRLRPLTGLTPQEQVAVWQEAAETAPNGKVTAAHVEEVVERRAAQSTGMAVHFSSKTDEWETPQRLFDILDDEFGFTLDVCALAGNAKCNRYFTPKDDGLSQDWGRMGEVCWMNPPYGDEIPKWVAKARQTAVNGSTVVCLLPARVDTSWWWDNCRFGEVRFLRGRLRFGGSDNSAPFPSAVVIFRPGGAPKVVWWEEWQ